MLTWEDDVEVRALHNRGWSISAIDLDQSISEALVKA